VNFGVTITGVTALDGVAVDSSGYIYAVNTTVASRIYKISLGDGSYTEFVNTGLAAGSQDIYFDAENNRLLVCAYSVAAPILAVDVITGAVSTVVASTLGFHDGITIDPGGNVYVTFSQAKRVLRYAHGFATPPDTLVKGIDEPAGLDFNWRDSVLAIPSFAGDSVMFVDCGDSDADLVINVLDNCPGTANGDQLDSDGDGVGEVCDNCPTTPNADQLDSDSDGIGDACASCCGEFTGGLTGNADCSTDGKRNLADITRLIDRVYISKLTLCCEENGNVDGDGAAKINLADITRLIDHVYISKDETATCE
jgi:hypothetical protein